MLSLLLRSEFRKRALLDLRHLIPDLGSRFAELVLLILTGGQTAGDIVRSEENEGIARAGYMGRITAASMTAFASGARGRWNRGRGELLFVMLDATIRVRDG
jgi:site-specific recombinase XerD